MSEDICARLGNLHVINENETSDNNIQEDHENITVKILEELNRIYQKRLEDIDNQANGDTELKSLTYKDWVEMLINLIKDLVDTVEELEYEACQRIGLLEKKLQIDCKIFHSNDVANIKKDFTNVLELIRRFRENQEWNTDGLQFCTIKVTDIFGNKSPSITGDATVKQDKHVQMSNEEKNEFLGNEENCIENKIKKLEHEKLILEVELKQKDLIIKDYKEKSDELDNIVSKREDHDHNEMSIDIEETAANFGYEECKSCIIELKQILETKDDEIKKLLAQNLFLQDKLNLTTNRKLDHDKAIVNQRALAWEVADKHDQILQMRDEINLLEEQVKQAHKKIQFKDNVIRELRKERKFHPKNFIDDSSSPKDITVFSPEYLSLSSPDSAMTDTTNETMKTLTNTGIEYLRKAHEEESTYINRLKKELEDFFQYQWTQEISFEDQKKSHLSQQNDLRELANHLLMALQTAYAKLSYIRCKLLDVTGDTNNNEYVEYESGYLSQEDVQKERCIIERINCCLQRSKEENYDLKNQIHKFQEDIKSVKICMCTTAAKADYNEKILGEVASVLSNIYGEDIICEATSSSECEVHPVCKAMIHLENQLCEKENALKILNENLSRREEEIQVLKNQNCSLERDFDIKNRTIAELQKAIASNENSLEKLQNLQSNLQTELCAQKELVKELKENITQLKSDKTKIETECEYQQTTISNLRKALEDSKRSPGGTNLQAVSSSGDSSQNNNGSIWSWWRSNVHDV